VSNYLLEDSLGFYQMEDGLGVLQLEGSAGQSITPMKMVSGNSFGDANLLRDLGRAAGFGFICAMGVKQAPFLGIEYQFGTHQLAVYESQFKGAVFPSVTVNPLTDAVTFFTGAPQAFDHTLQPWISDPSLFRNETIALSAEFQFGLHSQQVYDSQIQQQVFQSAAKAPSAPNPLRSIHAQGQELYTDLTRQGWNSIVPVKTGWLLTMITAAPQAVDLTLPAALQSATIHYNFGTVSPAITVGGQDPRQPAAILFTPPLRAVLPINPVFFFAQPPDDIRVQVMGQIFKQQPVPLARYVIPDAIIAPQQEYADIPQGMLNQPYVLQPPVVLLSASATFSTGTLGSALLALSGIYDYFSLVQAILDFSHRTDIVNYMDYYVSQGETRIYRDLFAQNIGNGVKWLEQPFSATIVNGTAQVPNGYFALKSMQLNVGNRVQTLLYKDPQWIYENFAARQPVGQPQYVARDGTNFVFGPAPDSAFTLSGTYYGSSIPLSATAPLSWMTTICPDLLLASCMLELQPFLKDSMAMKSWSDIYAAKLTALVNLDQSERMSPGTLTMET
jgi:hypothetical protein